MRGVSTLAVLAGTGTCFLSIGMLVPVLPLYLAGELDQGLGMVGLTAAMPSVTGILARPLAGRMVDRHGPRMATMAGVGLIAITAVALLGAGSLTLVLLCRTVTGIGDALVYVGLAAASVPADGTGTPAKITWFSLAVYGGLLLGAPFGLTVLTWWGFPAVWLIAALIAIIAAIIAIALPRGTPLSDVDKPPLVHPAGLVPGFAYGASVWGYTAFTTFIPLYVAELGRSNAQAEYLVYGAVLVGVRLLGHRLIGWLRPHQAAVIALLCTAAGLAVLVLWPRSPGLACGTALLAAGQALALPAFLAAAIDAVPAGHRVSVLATVTGFFDIGFLTAALALGVISQLFGLRSSFVLAAAMAAAALLLLVPWRRPSHRRPSIPASH
jgi:predicted MFS family arabinose efflux permease